MSTTPHPPSHQPHSSSPTATKILLQCSIIILQNECTLNCLNITETSNPIRNPNRVHIHHHGHWNSVILVAPERFINRPYTRRHHHHWHWTFDSTVFPRVSSLNSVCLRRLTGDVCQLVQIHTVAACRSIASFSTAMVSIAMAHLRLPWTTQLSEYANIAGEQRGHEQSSNYDGYDQQQIHFSLGAHPERFFGPTHSLKSDTNQSLLWVWTAIDILFFSSHGNIICVIISQFVSIVLKGKNKYVWLKVWSRY